MGFRWGWSPKFAARCALVAGVTTRKGGISPAPYCSLNMGLGVGDAAENVWQNLQQVRQRLPAARVVLLDQVHGTVVRMVTERSGMRVRPGFQHEGRGDGLLTRQQDLALCVTVADCVPIFLWSPAAQAVALLHAGWRGTVAGIVTTAVQLMRRRLEVAVRDLYLAQGPSIGPCCYQIGAEVVAAARAAGLDEALVGDPEKVVTFDLWRANQMLALRAGLRQARLEPRPPCTCCHDDYFSHRRDGPTTGRQAAVAALPAAGRGGHDGS